MNRIAKIITTLAIGAGIVTLASCTTIKDRDPAPRTLSTTTDSTTIQQPAPEPAAAPPTVETQTVRSY